MSRPPRDAGASARAFYPLQAAYLWVTGLRRRGALGLAAGLGALAQAGHAPVHFWPAVVPAFVGLIWLFDGAARLPAPKRAFFWRAWAFAFGYFVVGLYWVAGAFLVEWQKYAVFIPIAVSGLPAGLALFWGLAGVVAALLWTPDARRVAVFVAVFTVVEYLRGVAFTGFPWAWIGAIWPAGGPVSQLASVIGVWGLNALTFAWAGAAAALIDPRGRMGLRIAAPIIAALTFGAAWGWGSQRLSGVTLAPAFTARVADAGIPQREKWRPGNQQNVLRAYLEATGPDYARAPRVVVWPEGALPLLLLETPMALDATVAVLGERTLIVGTLRSDRQAGAAPEYYNALAVIEAHDGAFDIEAVYDKHILVPFGEYMPPGIREAVGLLGIKSLQAIGEGFAAGPSPGPIGAPPVGRAAPLICYESIFPGLAPRGPDRAEWLVNVTNDSWFGGLTGPWQHYNQARYRAIEEGLPLVRAASGGVSAIVDPLGREVASLDMSLKGPGYADGMVSQPLQPTFFARWLTLGMWLLVGLCLLVRLLPARFGLDGAASDDGI